MTEKTKGASRILEAVHETAADLHRLGFIDQRKMRQYDALCLAPIPEYDGEKIRSLRDHYQLSQTVLASLLNTSPSAVRQWNGVTSIPVAHRRSCSICWSVRGSKRSSERVWVRLTSPTGLRVGDGVVMTERAFPEPCYLSACTFA